MSHILVVAKGLLPAANEVVIRAKANLGLSPSYRSEVSSLHSVDRSMPLLLGIDVSTFMD